jgi:hypothetical protein
MGWSGRVFRGVRLGLLGATLTAGPALADSLGRVELAQAGTTSGQPGANRPAPFSITQNAVGYTASNIRFSIGPSAYIIPSAEIRGTTLSREDLANLLDPGSAVPLPDRVARLAASEIVIPEMRAETTAGAVRQSAVYRDVRVLQIGAGRAASAASGGGSFDGTSAEGPSRGTFARMEISDIDLGLMVALLEPQPDAPPAELRRVYGAFSLEGLTTEGPKGARSRIARMAGRDFRAKPTREGWIATANAFAGSTDLNKASPAERGRVVAAMLDLFEAFEIGSIEATGIEFSDAGGKDAAGRIGRIAYESGARGGEFRIEALEAGGDDGRVRIASFSVGGISLAPMLASARDLAGKAEIGAAEMRRLIPIVGSVRLTGLDVSTKGNPKTREAPTQASAGLFELLADKPVEGIPTELRLNLRDLSVPIAGTKDEQAKQLLALGYNRIEASLTADLGWNEAAQELVVRELSAQGAGMGNLVLRGVVGNLSREAFSGDEALAAIAWTGATARSLDIVVRNGGLLERVLGQQAAAKKRSIDDMRREYGMAAVVAIPVMLGNSPASKALGQAVARFVAKPGTLTVQLRTRDPAGLGVADFIGAPDPTSIIEKVEINATAE